MARPHLGVRGDKMGGEIWGDGGNEMGGNGGRMGVKWREKGGDRG